ncbi:hypothetical protein [Litoribacillus peritrichatus]|uniref:Tetratricopeptide repeat protein n=1 Tax=Litoribacillus peritrichatus TaxID=718191 RepID=A0ABP7MAA0_9GAMM
MMMPNNFRSVLLALAFVPVSYASAEVMTSDGQDESLNETPVHITSEVDAQEVADPAPNGTELESNPASAAESTDVQAAEETQASPEQEEKSLLQSEAPEVDLTELFAEAYVDFKEEDYESAAPKFLYFLQHAEEDAKNRDWAQFFFGISLEKNGYSHGAVDVMGNLVMRKPNTRIVNYILDMFEKVTREQPFDYDQIIVQAVNANEYDFVEKDLLGFVRFYQGINDWKYGLLDWGEQHFNEIPASSPYFYQYQYQKALYEIHNDDINAAFPYLKNVIQMEEKDQSLIDQALWTMARLYYETKDYEKATQYYLAIQTPLIEQASFLLEQAWIQYRSGHYEKAMGFLYAYNAPSFKEFFTPEYYILKSLIYKKLCYYDPAIKVVSDFEARYGRSLAAIYNRKTETDLESQEMLFVIMTHPKIKKQYEFLRLLETEIELIDELEDDNLQQYLLAIYNNQVEETAKQFRKDVKAQFKIVANSLLKYEEESNLIKYEIGIDMYQRVAETRYQGKTNTNQAETSPEKVVIYPFQGEFWNDELGNYKVSLPSKCRTTNDWEDFLE